MHRRHPCVLAVSLVLLASCSDPEIPPCETTCDDCCLQAEECGGEDFDECRRECVTECQRSSAVYSDTTCFEAKIALKRCVCSLSCTQLEQWQGGTSAHCSSEMETEAEECEWF
jgi:hypothetical protein